MLSTPVYTWYCTGCMKNVLDRCYGLVKRYGAGSGNLAAGKGVAILATHGYDRAYACEPFETGIRRLCEHDGARYLGLFTVCDDDELPQGGLHPGDAAGACAFAKEIFEKMQNTP